MDFLSSVQIIRWISIKYPVICRIFTKKVSQMDESSLTAWIVQMSETISEKLKCARNSSARRLIVEAQNIVKERYMEADISLDEICAVLGVSNS